MTIEKAIQHLVNEAINYNNNTNSKDFNMKSFLFDLQKKYDTAPKSKGLLNHKGNTIDQQIITHIGRLSRYAHFYLKNALIETSFTTDMDFAFTAILQQYGPMGKTELIKMMIYEKSSGMEIIKRLIKTKIFEQSENPNDKRSKLIGITDKGSKLVVDAYAVAGIAPKIVSFPLSDNEKTTLLDLLLKLDGFHNLHFLNGESNPNNILKL